MYQMLHRQVIGFSTKFCKINVTEAYIIIITKTNFNWLPAKQCLDDLTAKVQKMYKYRKVFFSQEFTFYRPLIKTSYEN